MKGDVIVACYQDIITLDINRRAGVVYHIGVYAIVPPMFSPDPSHPVPSPLRMFLLVEVASG